MYHEEDVGVENCVCRLNIYMYDLDIYLNGPKGCKIPCVCDMCGKNFDMTRNNLSRPFKSNQKTITCSRTCRDMLRSEKIITNCSNCDTVVAKHKSQYIRFKNHFCSHSCNATYTNTHKTKGNRRSKLEKWLEDQLTVLYPTLNILYSDKTNINSELDIYIPSLKLAFELNGIFHYEPIFGKEKLDQIRNNDGRKFQACIENGIELCIIDTSLNTNTSNLLLLRNTLIL